jgi:NhaA family Na+:H+ antiporter
VFYSADLSTSSLAAAGAGVAVLFILNRLGIQSLAAYLITGVFIWLFVLKSGVHATLAGIVVAAFIPLKSGDETSPAHHLEHILHPWVAYGVLPIFAFANAGVSFSGVSSDVVLGTVSTGILLGLFFGKQIGVFGLCFLSLKLKIAQLPRGINMGHLYGASLLCGIGFTMSLFIGGLAFQGGGAEKLFDERIGIILGSLISGGAGYAVLRMVARRGNVQG